MLFDLEPIGDGLYKVSTPHERVLVKASNPQFTALLWDGDVVLLKEDFADHLLAISDDPNVPAPVGFDGDVFWRSGDHVFKLSIAGGHATLSTTDQPPALLDIPQPDTSVIFELGYARVPESAFNFNLTFSLSNYRIRTAVEFPQIPDVCDPFIIEFDYCPVEPNSPIIIPDLDSFTPGSVGYTVPVSVFYDVLKVVPSQRIVAFLFDQVRSPMTKYGA